MLTNHLLVSLWLRMILQSYKKPLLTQHYTQDNDQVILVTSTMRRLLPASTVVFSSATRSYCRYSTSCSLSREGFYIKSAQVGANPLACLRSLRGIPLSVLVAVTNLFEGLVLLDKELLG